MSEHVYHYRAVDGDGAVRDGEMAGASVHTVADLIVDQGWVPLRIDVAQTRPVSRSRAAGRRVPVPWLRRGLTNRELLIFIRSLATLVTAGITVDRALQINATLTRVPSQQIFARRLLEAVRSGDTLARALGQSGQRLPPFMVSMVEAGETGGTLGPSLERIGELEERRLEVRARVLSALIYPALLATMVLVTLLLLLVVVLPRFKLMFADSLDRLPTSTRVTLSIAQFIVDDGWLLLLAVALCTVAFARWYRTAWGRRQFDGWLVRSRLTLDLPRNLDTARLLRTASTLCENGAPLPTALRIARGTLSNRCLRAALDRVLSDVQAGSALSASLARTTLFPDVAIQLARVGEETGQLPELLRSSAKMLEQDSALKVDRVVSLLVPALTVGMGLIVAGLIGSVLLGLLSVNELAL